MHGHCHVILVLSRAILSVIIGVSMYSLKKSLSTEPFMQVAICVHACLYVCLLDRQLQLWVCGCVCCASACLRADRGKIYILFQTQKQKNLRREEARNCCKDTNPDMTAVVLIRVSAVDSDIMMNNVGKLPSYQTSKLRTGKHKTSSPDSHSKLFPMITQKCAKAIL